MEDHNHLGGGSSLLSPDLKASFDTLNSIVRAQKRLKHSIEHESQSSIENDTVVGKKRRVSSADELIELRDEKHLSYAELEDCKFEVALATALSAEEEISRLQSGIAELESLLLQEGDGNSLADVPFPSLPYIIPDLDAENSINNSVGLAHSSDGQYHRHTASEEIGVAKSLSG
eukprot:CAMPEP_0197822972 /NCGR_PEP_ID=MMETSP1437-20131217/286_1 /TAXON_ID=49252 ORGANISM="Eucampia antarctica, Strain CCMP1452" /NCGR_SAMPLE_ID=MMETSP1437 /ASSEMBLY_ACC=CAM_ASM_001096 /LENGTH=173 /DNA_ID=CAMNT_0043421887 /DNA_START=594 /DNA_END=1115 /DNA_ORIENTATION=+